ncbi:DEAD/DEAH box helicase [Candidatus Bathyarchaeota archaeon]|nr:MAG: DEAD/DEAH box helicase [Candidatus Bathyarchaeota archaeon]
MDGNKLDYFIQGLKKEEGYKDQIVHIEYLPAKQAELGQLDYSLPRELQRYLDNRQIKLYKHQTEAVNYVRDGKNVVIATPTASGKTLSFNLPVLEAMMKDPEARALYIYPMKALENDQLNTLKIMEQETGIKINPKIYDGDTPSDEKRIIRDQSRIILSNPYGLHHYLPWHHLWKKFFTNLKYIIIDESHTYRGVYGSNVALLFRRINRICNYYGSKPQYILSSATIANPEEHSRKLTGQEFKVVSEDGSESGTKQFVFWNPPFLDDDLTRRAAHHEARKLMGYCVIQEYQTLCFTKSRKMAELIGMWVKRDLESNHADLVDAVCSYRAGYLPEARREIEKKLKRRQISGVVTTNALELGIDIGSLDCVIMAGYPGTVISTWQQAGRAGRLVDDSIVFLVAYQNPLDQYFMKHPREFFTREPENAVINLDNPYITTGHIMCASKELFLTEGDREFFTQGYDRAIRILEDENQITQTKLGWEYVGQRNPVARVKLNNISDENIAVMFGSKTLETMDINQAFREAHEGAILLHQGEPYLVTSLDLYSHKAYAEEADGTYYTEALKIIDISIIEKHTEKDIGITTGIGNVNVTEHYTEYRKIFNDNKRERYSLILPPLNFPTVGFWFTVPPTIASKVNDAGLDFAGGIHALEHALIAICPLYAMCDPQDLGGVSTLFHSDTKGSSIFVYDGYKGGIGLAEKLFTLLPELLETTLNLIRDCECTTGCPSCIYSPKCGNNNDPLDKKAAIIILEAILNII